MERPLFLLHVTQKMKILSGDELEELISKDNDGDVLLNDVVFRGPLYINRACRVFLDYTDSSCSSDDAVSKSNITISGTNIHLRGLRIEGIVYIDSQSADIILEDCIIKGSIRMESEARKIHLKYCVISPTRRMSGIHIANGVNVTIERCHISNCISGISVSRDITSECFVNNTRLTAVQCFIDNCVYEHNTTDVVGTVYIHSGHKDEELVSSVCFDDILRIRGDSVPTMEISICGILDPPLQFKEWPIPVDSIPLVAKRRGGRLSSRYCHFSTVGDVIVITQDPRTDQSLDTPRGRKRKEPSQHEYTKAEIYYSRVLAIQPGSSSDEILSAYRKLALQHHPDKTNGESERFILIKRARDELIRILNNR